MTPFGVIFQPEAAKLGLPMFRYPDAFGMEVGMIDALPRADFEG